MEFLLLHLSFLDVPAPINGDFPLPSVCLLFSGTMKGEQPLRNHRPIGPL